MSERQNLGYALTLVVLSVLWAGAGPARADNIQRSCDAMFRIHMSRAEDANHRRLVDIAKVWGLGERSEDYQFSARRGCGRSVPNRCRRRASEAAMKCMQAHAQNLSSTPAACRTNGVQGYRIGNLEKVVQQTVCNYMNKYSGVNPGILPKPYYISTTIKARVFGDKGCGGGDRYHIERDLRTIIISCPVGQ